MKRRLLQVAAVTCALVLAAACSTDDQPGTGAPRIDPPTVDASDRQPRPTRPEAESIADRCDFEIPGRTFVISGPDDESWLSAATLGHGPSVGIFLPETSASGLCGWLPYAEWAARHGIRAVLVDACGYGRSVCSDAVRRDVEAWVGATVDWARDHGARRITLVGASMGGTLATGVGQRLGVDAIVNLSGPPSWQDVPRVVVAARSIRVPFLVAASDTDTGIDIAALRKAVRAAPADVARYVATPGGHGWSMLTTEPLIDEPSETRPTPLAKLLLGWLHGDVR